MNYFQSEGQIYQYDTHSFMPKMVLFALLWLQSYNKFRKKPKRNAQKWLYFWLNQKK